MRHEYNYCPNCATPLESLPVQDDGGFKMRLRCPACAWTHWNNPLPVLAAVIVFIVCDRGDRYLSTGVFPA